MDEMKDPITLDFIATQAPAEDAPVGQKALDSERPPVRVVLLALDQGKFDSQRSLDELAALAEANGMQAVATVCQKRSTPEAATLLGEGKVEEARLVCLNTDAEAAIFDGELTGSQIRNLSAALQVEVLDRTMLILEIFRARATTNEGKLQTELATLKYRMPRLQGLGGFYLKSSTYPTGISAQAHPSIFNRTAILLLPSTVTSSPTSPVKGPLTTRTFSPRAKGALFIQIASSE